MTDLTARPYTGRTDLALLVEFARSAMLARQPGLSYLHSGDMVWQLYPAIDSRWFDNIRIWEDGEGVAAYAMFAPPINAQFDIRPGWPLDGELADDILDWCEGRRHASARPGGDDIPIALEALGQGSLSIQALDSDAPRIAMLEARGFVKNEQHAVRYRRSLDVPIPESVLPRGARVRHATDSDIAARAELHREAWSVWGKSPFSERRYRLLRETPGYDEELDIVTEAADGSLASCCICWADTASGVGCIEPVGTRPGYTGQGYARAAIHEGMRRLRDRGIHTSLIGTASVNQRALRLYPSCGFEFDEAEHYYTKRNG